MDNGEPKQSPSPQVAHLPLPTPPTPGASPMTQAIILPGEKGKGWRWGGTEDALSYGVSEAPSRRPGDEVVGPAQGQDHPWPRGQRIKARGYSNSAPRHLPEGNENMWPHKRLSVNVHCSRIQDSQNVDTTQMPTNRGRAKHRRPSHLMECDSARERSGVHAIWMHSEDVSERSQLQKTIDA